MDSNMLKYRLSKLAMLVSLFAVVVCILSISVKGIFDLSEKIEEYPALKILNFTGNPITLVIVFVIAFIVIKKSGDIHEEVRDVVEHDEFGLNKKKTRANMSKAEKDALDMQNLANMERIISQSAIKKITKKGSKNPMEDLKKMTGMEPVKQKVEEMAARMQFEDKNRKKNKKKNTSQNEESRHMVFLGAPGTGKTTVARIITGFLYDNEFIKENKIIEVDGNFLKAGTSGDTATKTKFIIRKAYGGVLFIDEAYSLTEHRDPCGMEAVATLLKEMEDNRDKFILIMAGYTENMKNMLATNPGFESRIRDYVVFPDYTEEEAKQIFIAMANEKNFVVDAGALDNFAIRYKAEKQLSSFGNARTVRTILDKAIDKHSYNYMKHKILPNNKYKIMDIDVDKNTDSIFV